MMNTGEEKGQPDWMLAAAMAVLLAALLAATNVSTLNSGTYTMALHILQNAPMLPSEIVASTLYHLPGIGTAQAGAAGVLSYLLNLPMVLAALSALFAFGALRYLGFDRMESALAGLLLLFAQPVYEAFMPGFLPPVAFAIPLALIGMLGIAYASSQKEEIMQAIGSLVALVTFSLSIWILPISALVALGLLIGELMLAQSTHAKKERKAGPLVWAKWASLALPLLVLAISMPQLPSLNAAIGAWESMPNLTWGLLGLAAISIPAGLRVKAHPASRLFLPLIPAALLAMTVSPAMALVALLLPAAYGMHTLRTLEEETPVWRMAMIFVCLIIVFFGLLYGHESSDILRAGGLSALAAAGGVALAQLWGWNAGVVRHGVGILLLGFAMLLAIAYLPGVASNDPYKEYKALDYAVQFQLLDMGNSSSHAPIATFAPADAVKFLSGAEMAGNSSQLANWLTGAKDAGVPYASGTRIIVPLSVFDSFSLSGSEAEKNWTLEAFHFMGVANGTQTQVAVFYNYNGLRIDHPLDMQTGGLAASKNYLYSLTSGTLVKILMVGEVQLLEPDLSYSAPGNLLIWPNQDLNSRLLELYISNPAGVRVLSRTPDALVLEVI